MSDRAYRFLQDGKRLMKSGSPAEAARVLERAKRLYPEKSSIRELLGQAYYNSGGYEEAGTEFTKALEIEPTNDYAHFGLALCLSKQGQTVRAVRHLKLAIAMKPNSEDYIRAFSKIVSAQGPPEPRQVEESIFVVDGADGDGVRSPERFSQEGKEYRIVAIEKTWFEHHDDGVRALFRVLTGCGRLFDISREERTGHWCLETEL
ncbi:MAG: tetratricopeptide repeat protein [Terriglobia bacterium]